MQSFSELSPNIGTLSVYLWSTNSNIKLAEMISSLETLFKSDDGKFKLLIKHKQTKAIVGNVIIKDEHMSIRIKPGLTQFASLD